MDKKELRALMKAEKSKLSKEDIATYSKEISEKFFENTLYKSAKVIYVYLPYNQEIDTSYIVKRALLDGKIVAAPKVLDDGVMEFYQIKSLDDVSLGYKNIPEPKGDTEPVKFDNVLILMPGLAFDKTHARIGYGGGFYDRYLEHYEKTGTKFTKVALAYDFQIVPSIPLENHDKKVDVIITKSLVI